MVNKELLDKFKSLYKDKFNVVLTDEEATEMATNFVNLMKVLLKPKSIIDETDRTDTKYL